MPAVEGKVAVVTGASSGIGEAIVKELVGAGVIVAGLARRIDRVVALAATLKGQKGKLSAIKCDVTKEDDVISAFAWVEKNLGPPDFVINNAGVLKQTMISSCDLKDIQVMFDTNVVGIAACSREALKSMVKNKTEGTIININSVAGHFILPFPGIHGYNASKFAVTALTEGLRNEVTVLNANIRVTALAATLKGQKGKLSAIKCDVTKEDDVISAFAWVEKNLGPPDFVINNAGVLKQTMISSCDLKDIQVMFDTNVIGIASCSREALKSMVKNKTEGTIININSVAGYFIHPFPGIHGYNASKFAVTALTEGLRNEVTVLNANIRVTSLSPGAVESEMTDRFKNDDSNSAVDHFDMLPAKDIADCALFILQAPQRMNVSEMRVLSTKETTLSVAQVTAKFLEKAAPK